MSEETVRTDNIEIATARVDAEKLTARALAEKVENFNQKMTSDNHSILAKLDTVTLGLRDLMNLMVGTFGQPGLVQQVIKLEKAFEEVHNKLTNMEGKRQGLSLSWGIAIAVIMVVLGAGEIYAVLRTTINP